MAMCDRYKHRYECRYQFTFHHLEKSMSFFERETKEMRDLMKYYQVLGT